MKKLLAGVSLSLGLLSFGQAVLATGDTYSCPEGTIDLEIKYDALGDIPVWQVPDAPPEVSAVIVKAGKAEHVVFHVTNGDTINVKEVIGHGASHAHLCGPLVVTTTTITETTTSTTTVPENTTTSSTSTTIPVVTTTSTTTVPEETTTTVPVETTTTITVPVTTSVPTTVPLVPTLPETGADFNIMVLLIGTLFIFVGIVLVRKLY